MIASQEVTAAVLLPIMILLTVCQAVNLGRYVDRYRSRYRFGNEIEREAGLRSVQWSAVALLFMLGASYALILIMLSNRVPS